MSPDETSSARELWKEIERLRGQLQELRETEEKLAASEERYRNLFETVLVGLYQTSIESGQILDANQALVDLMGYETRERFMTEFRTSEHYADPKRRGELLKELEEHGKLDMFEIEATRCDGSIVPIAISATLYRDSSLPLERFWVTEAWIVT